ncbi:MAG: twin-arginine translocase TatA/TatE family subunit [Candidatus Dadabacteria bacterium]|nr:twin-arginine translocase TatA/TatE family subunit [Candidatus Dadabacteria bacterium]NIS09099.1 twin-arginine translocase TatA/TatE family subunit [Candidatus Dadabacteria bacterium]NIV41535.1 twin-arginine translocase TatA/TatE family subunit [Candidatus Dadabacteria bacterium]NIX15216.1 twin-arginine translocase TatA/TatE family subunit [Candidatus Dadabacteria bacterium]NIY21860.1 twin-arginine translocase TatA/TatE family subunit [Candidatus Dadabacteria bacterium]
MGNIGGWELIIILVILLLIFGPSRLGDLGTALGKGIKGFKRSMKEPDEIDVTPNKENPDKIEDTDLDKAQKNSEKESKVE